MGLQARYIQTNFTGGELSPRLRGRVDVTKYYNAAKTLLNTIVYAHGGTTSRTGNYFATETKDSSVYARLIPFIFSTTQNYILEFGSGYMRVCRLRGQVQNAAKNITGATAANPVVITSVAHGFANGDQLNIEGVIGMTQLNGRRVAAANVTANTLELAGVNGTAYGAYVSGGTMSKPYELVVPWVTSALIDLKFTQSDDVLYVAHPLYAPRKISRTADDAWSIGILDYFDGPFLDINTTQTKTLQPSGTTGNVTVTAGGHTPFAATDVGRLIRIKEGGAWFSLKITAFTDNAHVQADIDPRQGALSASAAVFDWRLGAWSDSTGWPACVTLFQERTLWGATRTQPQTLWTSKTNDFETFSPTKPDGTVEDGSGCTFTISDDQVNAIRWFSPGKNAVVIGTSDAEHIMYGGSNVGAFSALTPTNVAVSRETTHGSAPNVRVKRIGKDVMFVQPSRRRVRATGYVAASDTYEARDITLISEHITKTGIVDFDYQEEIDSIGWMVRTDGVLLGFTYDNQQQVLAFHRHTVGGAYSGGDAIVESIGVIPAPDPIEGQDLWSITKRTINGATRRYIEFQTPPFDPELNGQASGVFLDSALTYDGIIDATLTLTGTTGTGIIAQAGSTPFTAQMIGRKIYALDEDGVILGKGTIVAFATTSQVTIDVTLDFSGMSYAASRWAIARESFTGLWHLEGESISVQVDGAVHPNVTVANGAITLNDFFYKVHVGEGYRAEIEFLPPENPSVGSIQGLIQRATSVFVYFYNTLGGEIGYITEDGTEKFEPILSRSGADLMDTAPPLFTGVKKIDIPGGYSRSPRILIRQNQPAPMSVLYAVWNLEANSGG